jgi:hypothetical protein
MKLFQRLLAQTENIGPNSILKSLPTTLLSPVPLYRRILRAHRKLPKDHRVLGDMYVKSEFQAHKEVENPIHIVRFSVISQKLIVDLRFRLDF